ncbi:MAG: hypothetical protein ACKV2V_01335 [Blastocatellia bacterium]
MRVIVSVKDTPGGGPVSQATRYIAYRERDDEREGPEPRPLFSARADTLSYREAEQTLSRGHAPDKAELMHIVVSLRPADFAALGRDETTRRESLREVARTAVSELREDLRAGELRWVAGIHRNTDNPHLHLLLHRAYTDREGAAESWLARLPESALPGRFRDEQGAEWLRPGSFGQAFENALDRAQEQARNQTPDRAETNRLSSANRPGEDGAQKDAQSFGERLLAAARENPSPAGRELLRDIIQREADHPRAGLGLLREALRPRALAETEYRSPYEQADHLGRHSQELRDLYERGAQLRGETLVLPAEAHELSEDRDQPFINSPAYARQRIADPEKAAEFFAFARTIAGQTADTRTEIEVFRHYYGYLGREDAGKGKTEQTSRLDQTLAEMRELAREMAALETRDSVEIARPVVSLDALLLPEHGRQPEQEDRDEEFSGGRYSTAARYVREEDTAPRLPQNLGEAALDRLVSRTIPATDRLLESGRSRNELFTAIDEAIRDRALSAAEREERHAIGAFLKEWINERLRDPETRALNSSAAFREAHAQFSAARTPAKLNQTAETFLRDNLRRSEQQRLYERDPARQSPPDIPPLDARQRSLLFYGRAAEHHTAEMRELRYAWGLSRGERAERVGQLREGTLAPSPALDKMLTELDERRTEAAVRHYQASILNREMNRPGRVDLRQL